MRVFGVNTCRSKRSLARCSARSSFTSASSRAFSSEVIATAAIEGVPMSIERADFIDAGEPPGVRADMGETPLALSASADSGTAVGGVRRACGVLVEGFIDEDSALGTLRCRARLELAEAALPR